MNDKPTYEELERRIRELEEAESNREKGRDLLEKRIAALTRPAEDTGGITFEDLFSIQDIQRLQDEFADATGVASIITHTDGTPITAPSNFCRLCKDIIRKTDKGLRNCFNSDAVIGRFHPEGPVIQPCMSGGLWDAGAGITVGGRHIANWLIGQVRDETQTGEGIRAYARQIGADEALMLEAFNEVTPMSRDRFSRIARMLFTIANQLSISAYQNVQQARIITTLKQVQNELSKSEEKYRALVESSTDFIWEVGPEGLFSYASPRAKDILGYDPEEIIGRSPMSLMPEDEAARVQAPFTDAMVKKGPVIGLVTVNRHKNGHSVILETNAVPIIEDSGRVTGCRGMSRDITARKAIERKLKERQELLDSIIKVAPIGIGMVVDRVITMANSRVSEITGYDIDEIIGRSARVLYPSREAYDWVGENKYEQIKVSGTGTVETKWVTKSGKPVDILLSSTPLDPADLSKGVTFTALDITGRKNAEKALQKSENRYRSVYETAPLAFVVWDTNCQILDWNEQAEKMFGWTRSKALGKNFFDLIVPDEERQFVEQVVKDLNDGKIQNHAINRNITKDNNVIWCEWNNTILRDTEGNIKAALSLGLDITNRKKTEEELKQHRQHLEELVEKRTLALEDKNKELETFTYTVSHDLKAPLRGIDGYSRLLLEEYGEKLDAQGQQFLQNVRYCTEQMNQLIEDLLAYSRMERRELQLDSIDLPFMIDAILREREHDLTQRGIVFTNNLPFTQMQSDAKSIRQILGNLFDNAIKFSRYESDARIEINGSETTDVWTLWVKDNGVGFDPKYQDRIFGIFQRLHRSEEYPGTGVGLAIVQKAINRMSGRIWAEGELGKGATFYVQVPKVNFFPQSKG